MKELLFTKSPAVAALNQIDGFNPLELARTIANEGQEEQRYLDVKYRKLWFRLVHPIGKIISHIVNYNENMALVEARVYLDKSDAPDSYIANSFSQKFRSNDPLFGDKFLEMAETAAIGRALADAGFGLQLADVGEANDPFQVDAGYPVVGQEAMTEAVPPTISGNITPQQVQPQMPFEQSHPGMMNQFYQQAQAEGMTMGPTQTPGNMGVTGTIPQQTLAGGMHPITSEQPMTYEQATQVLIGGSGKFTNKTMGQVAIESPSSLEWFANQYSGKDKKIREAAKIIIEKALPMVG